MSKERLIKTLCRELDELGEKRELTMSDLEKAEKLSSAAKNLMKMEAMEAEGYSGAWEAHGGYARDSYARRGSYDGGGSYEGGRGYSGRRRYSRDAYPMDDDPRERMDRFQNEMKW